MAPDGNKKFHEFAVKSILFKGHTDLYLCYLKAEKIAHVLSLLQTRSASEMADKMQTLVSAASRLPETILHFAAGEIDITVILADIFALITATRLADSQQFIESGNSVILTSEYERLAEKLAGGTRLSPFIADTDFVLPSLPAEAPLVPLIQASETLPEVNILKDNKGQNKGQKDKQNDISKRASLILEFVRKHKNVSIKEIGKVIKGFSEKTIQRELALLIQLGLVEKRGERRWSIYSPR